MEESLFRKKSLAHISSPEQMDDYLRVTDPAVWMLLLAAAILIVGLLIWGVFASFESFTTGKGKVEYGKMTIQFDDPDLAKKVRPGMKVTTGETETTISSVGKAEDGSIFAVADTGLSDGMYPVRITYKRTQVISLLIN